MILLRDYWIYNYISPAIVNILLFQIPFSSHIPIILLRPIKHIFSLMMLPIYRHRTILIIISNLLLIISISTPVINHRWLRKPILPIFLLPKTPVLSINHFIILPLILQNILNLTLKFILIITLPHRLIN